MQSRMDRYKEKNQLNTTRSEKNSILYRDLYENSIDKYGRLPVSTNVNEIDLETLKKLTTRKEYQEQLKENKDYNQNNDSYIKEERIHDINKLLELARTNTSLKQIDKTKLTNYEYLTKLNGDIKKECMEEDIKKELERLDKEIENVKKEIDPSLDLFEELKGDENTIVTKPAKEDIKTNLELQKEFYSGTLDFAKEDIEDMEEEEKSIWFKVLVIILTLSAVSLAVLYVIKNI